MLFGDDHLVGTELDQVVALSGVLGGGKDLQPQGLAHLHEGRARTMTGIGDQRSLPSLGPGQIDIGEIGHQQRRVMDAGLNRRQNLRITG
ncbi:hypothetical protein D3C75_1232850 [compost metagenome]